MSSIVIDLQSELLNNNCDIVNVLRKSHVIASKLKLNNFDNWVMNELNGYQDADLIPSYRQIRGELKALNPYNGWIPVMLDNNDLENTICVRAMGNSIDEILQLCKESTSGYCSMQFNAEQTTLINTLFEQTLIDVKYQIALFISVHLLRSIIEKTKNTLLEWTINLEAEGILGEGLVFTKEEKNAAKLVSQSITNYNGPTTIINAEANQANIVTGNENEVVFNYEKFEEIIKEIKESIEKEIRNSEDLKESNELLKEIREKIDKKKKPSIIKSAFIGLKEFLISAGASLTATLIQAKIQGLF